MTDEAKALVERLREVGRDGVWKSGRNPTTAHPMCIKAADLIETQAREIERLREALRNIRALATKRQNVWGPDGCLTDIECFAIAALAGDSHDLKR